MRKEIKTLIMFFIAIVIFLVLTLGFRFYVTPKLNIQSKEYKLIQTNDDIILIK